MTQLAVEACTASLVLTGYVHADPTKGNMLREDGKVVFPDFDPRPASTATSWSPSRRAFACLAEDREPLARAFQDVGFPDDAVAVPGEPETSVRIV